MLFVEESLRSKVKLRGKTSVLTPVVIEAIRVTHSVPLVIVPPGGVGTSS